MLRRVLDGRRREQRIRPCRLWTRHRDSELWRCGYCDASLHSFFFAKKKIDEVRELHSLPQVRETARVSVLWAALIDMRGSLPCPLLLIYVAHLLFSVPSSSIISSYMENRDRYVVRQ
jgi:hypothetical protein